MTKAAKPVSRSYLHATRMPATTKARPSPARNVRADATTAATERRIKGVSRPGPA